MKIYGGHTLMQLEGLIDAEEEPGLSVLERLSIASSVYRAAPDLIQEIRRLMEIREDARSILADIQNQLEVTKGGYIIYRFDRKTLKELNACLSDDEPVHEVLG